MRGQEALRLVVDPAFARQKSDGRREGSDARIEPEVIVEQGGCLSRKLVSGREPAVEVFEPEADARKPRREMALDLPTMKSMA